MRQHVDKILSQMLDRQLNLDGAGAALLQLSLAPKNGQPLRRVLVDFCAGYLSRSDVFTILGV